MKIASGRLRVPVAVLGAGVRAGVFLLCLFGLGVESSRAATAPNTNSVLILGSTNNNAATSFEAYEAASAGFTVVVAADADWSAMSTADFASYKAIIFADGMCSGTLKAALANPGVWGPAVTGNVIVMGDHPGNSAMFTASAQSFVQTAILFAAAGQGTARVLTSRWAATCRPRRRPTYQF